jgi:hypothetical protein
MAKQEWKRLPIVAGPPISEFKGLEVKKWRGKDKSEEKYNSSDP